LVPVPVLVTDQVWREVTADPIKAGVSQLQAASDTGLLTVVPEGDPAAYPQLDAGESTVLSAAAASAGATIIDERKARALIHTDPQLRQLIRQTTGLVGLIILAKRRGRIAAVRPLLDTLIQQSFRISSALYQDALGLVGEV
jgi:predicted nucleic acid-binding protein